MSDQQMEQNMAMKHMQQLEGLHEKYKSYGWKYCPWCGERIDSKESNTNGN